MDTTLILIKKCVAVIEFKQGWAGIDQPSNQCGGCVPPDIQIMRILRDASNNIII
jgi:hypothetical protein